MSDEPAAGRTGAYVGSAESPADVPGADELTGTVIAGKYTLDEIIGEGGMGSVWGRGRPNR